MAKANISIAWAPHFIVHRLLIVCWCLPLFCLGCSVCFTNAKTGTETLIGAGELKLQTNHIGNRLQVVSRVAAPGLCFAIGKSHFGVGLGYVSRERLVVVADTSG